MRAYFETILSNLAASPRLSYEFAVLSAGDKRFMGFADIHAEPITPEALRAEIGYFLLPEYWGKGYATEVAKALLAVSFQELKLHKVVASCNEHNSASQNVLLKAGMTKEGVFRKERFKDGHWDDEFRYGILNSEWDPKNNVTIHQL